MEALVASLPIVILLTVVSCDIIIRQNQAAPNPYRNTPFHRTLHRSYATYNAKTPLTNAYLSPASPSSLQFLSRGEEALKRIKKWGVIAVVRFANLPVQGGHI